MVVSLSLAFVCILSLLALRLLLAPAERRHRQAVVWRIWRKDGAKQAYEYAHARRWPETQLVRPVVVREDPIGGPEVTAEYHALHRRALKALKGDS